ncbi:MAG: glutamate-5-semialdehyde dehydrogenase [Clostridiales bacterium]|nr:glutamate-5-semialdehyde dehydrogenase [Clostridiales bacterium]
MTEAKLYLEPYGKKAKTAVVSLANSPESQRNDALKYLAEIIDNNKEEIYKVNKIDVDYANQKGLSSSMVDRLVLNEKRIFDMTKGLYQLVDLKEYCNKVESVYTREDGLVIEKILVPLGVIAIIYESRPNVTVDAAGLCIKSGNVCILRGGSEAINTNKLLTQYVQQALEKAGLDGNSVQLVQKTDRAIANELMSLNEYVDLLVPRGSANLINAVTKNATVPVIQTGAGNCHIYVEKTADFNMALDIITNAKIQKPSACNAVEKVLVDRSIAKEFLPLLCERMSQVNVITFGCDECVEIANTMRAEEETWYTEFNDMILAVKVVSGIDEALERIAKYSTKHSEAIITSDDNLAKKFLQSVDSSAVYHNASTRFSDGFEFGMGAEIGISTQKLHARGPMGLRELYTTKYLVKGTGHTRK